MRCAVCKTGEIAPDKVTVTLERGEMTVVIKDVPAELCDICGEYYLADAVDDVDEPAVLAEIDEDRATTDRVYINWNIRDD